MTIPFDQAVAELRQRKSEPDIGASVVLTVLTDAGDGQPASAYAWLRYVSFDTPRPLSQFVSPDHLEGTVDVRWYGPPAAGSTVEPDTWDFRLDIGGGLIRGPVDLLRRRTTQVFPGPLLWIKASGQNTPTVSVKMVRDGSFIRGIGTVVRGAAGVIGMGMYSLVISDVATFGELGGPQ
jgi:hypothetical protein